MQRAPLLEPAPRGLTMNDREGHRLDGLAWKRESLDGDLRAAGRRREAYGSQPQYPMGMARAGDMNINSSSSSNSGANISSSSNGFRRFAPAAHASSADVDRGFGALRSGSAQKPTGWSSSQSVSYPVASAASAAAAGGGTAAAAMQQQRKGHSAAPAACPAARGSFSGIRRQPQAAEAAAPAAAAAAGQQYRGRVSAKGPTSPVHAEPTSRQPSSPGDACNGFAALRRDNSSSKASQDTPGGPEDPAGPRREGVGAPAGAPTTPRGTPGGAPGNSPGTASGSSPAGAPEGPPALVWKPRRALTREEELRRSVKSLLNKLTIEKFSVISEKIANILEGSLENNEEVRLIVDAMIDKAVTEPDWSEMYADLCQLLQWRSVAPYGDPETIRKTAFMLSLLTRIQEEFEAMPSVLQPRVCGSAEEQQQEEARLKRRVLGVVKLIGELFHRKLLGFKVVNDVVVELVMRSEQPDEHLVECFLQLIATVGYFIDQNPKLKVVLDSWFGRLRELQSKSCYSKRIKCVIQDTIDMRRAEWRKKIHKERAKALDALHDQLETEEVLGGAVHAAQYGNIIVVGERTNLNGQYLDYLKDQENKYQERVKNRLAAAAARGSATMNK